MPTLWGKRACGLDDGYLYDGRYGTGGTLMHEATSELQGTWQAVRMEVASSVLSVETARRLRYVFEGGRVTLLEDGKPSGIGSFTALSKETLKTIDVIMTEGPATGQKALGVYQVTGDRLTMCIGPDRPDGFRPTGAAALVDLERVAGGSAPAA
jgi:uncharacterized protein (TIGR03067 family)